MEHASCGREFLVAAVPEKPGVEIQEDVIVDSAEFVAEILTFGVIGELAEVDILGETAAWVDLKGMVIEPNTEESAEATPTGLGKLVTEVGEKIGGEKTVFVVAFGALGIAHRSIPEAEVVVVGKTNELEPSIDAGGRPKKPREIQAKPQPIERELKGVLRPSQAGLGEEDQAPLVGGVASTELCDSSSSSQQKPPIGRSTPQRERPAIPVDLLGVVGDFCAVAWVGCAVAWVGGSGVGVLSWRSTKEGK